MSNRSDTYKMPEGLSHLGEPLQQSPTIDDQLIKIRETADGDLTGSEVLADLHSADGLIYVRHAKLINFYALFTGGGNADGAHIIPQFSVNGTDWFYLGGGTLSAGSLSISKNILIIPAASDGIPLAFSVANPGGVWMRVYNKGGTGVSAGDVLDLWVGRGLGEPTIWD